MLPTHISLVNHFKLLSAGSRFLYIKTRTASLIEAILHDALHFCIFIALSEYLLLCLVSVTGTFLSRLQGRLPPYLRNATYNDVAYNL